MYKYTHTLTRNHKLKVSFCLLLIQQATRRLCVLLSAKPVYAASDVWGCSTLPNNAPDLVSPLFFPPLSISWCWVEDLFYSECNNSGPVSNSVCKNTSEVLEGQDFMHSTTQTEAGGSDETIYYVFLLPNY